MDSKRRQIRSDWRHRSEAVLVALITLALWSSAVPSARAVPVSGPHETVEITTSTTLPNTSASLSYAATYRNPTDPNRDPPALRRLVISLPTGTRIDTALQTRCEATDMQIRVIGDGACPPASREGTGQATVDVVGVGRMTFNTTLFNAPDDSLEVVESGAAFGSNGVLHTYVHGTTLDGPVPTCIAGGNPPSGCPADQVIALTNHLTVLPFTAGQRSSSITPPSCPATGAWQTPVTFYYADGTVETVVTKQPCQSGRSGGGRPTPAGGPNRGRCISKRRFAIHLPRAHIRRLRSVLIVVNGRRHHSSPGHLTVDLRGLPKGLVTVRIIAVTTRGQRVLDIRHYRTCSPTALRHG